MDQRILLSTEVKSSTFSKKSSVSSFVEVAVNAPLTNPLLYSMPQNSSFSLPQRGQRVLVGLKKRFITGVVVGYGRKSGDYEIKEIVSLDSESPPLPELFLKWLEWLSEYYIHPLGQVLALSFFPFKKQKGTNSFPVKIKNEETKTFSFEKKMDSHFIQKEVSLNEEQKKCVQDIQKSQGFKTHLLYGVTGSGKTEVYLSLIRDTLKKGKKALILIPEISLTPQLVQSFSFRFPNQVAVIHSSLTQREKILVWKAVLKGERKILIGARSALFCPIYPLGLIVVDEEHETTFKQSEKLKYHARDAAIMLAQFYQCPIVLGSATPSMESWKKAKENKYKLHRMKNRVLSASLPQTYTVDMRREKKMRDIEKEKQKIAQREKERKEKREKFKVWSQFRNRKTKFQNENKREKKKENIFSEGNQIKGETKSALPIWMSHLLYQKLTQNLEKKEQSVLFLNRRGTAHLSLCQSCGHVLECPNCSVPLTLHQHQQFLCHYCHHTEALNESCTQCQNGVIKPLGLGTEKIEKDLKELFPHIKTLRADRDEISSYKELEALIRNMEKEGQIDVLIGTQMIAKGLNFPFLTLVGFVLADIGFNLPDFRASEKSFQLITQMSGRPGRFFQKESQVVIQTFNPRHASLVFAHSNNYEGFAHQELSHRSHLHYPPYGRLVLFKIQGAHQKKTEKIVNQVGKRAHQIKDKHQSLYSSLQILGPSPSPLFRLRGKHRFHLLIKSLDGFHLRAFSKELLSYFDSHRKSGVQVQVDVDPVHML